MADHAKPILTDNYTDVLSQIRGRFEDQAKGFDPANTSATNITTGTIRWNSAEKKFQKWSGTAWGELTDNYVLSGATFSAGTPNGVMYLNGSKAVTTGSALTFDGTNLTATGKITASGAALSGFGAGTAGGNLELGWDGTQTIVQGYNRTSSTYVPLWLESSYTRFGIAGTEQMRLTSTGLGIGTSSPVGRLTLRGAAGTSGKNQGILLEYSNGTEYGALGLNNSSGWPQLMARTGAGMTFHVNSDLVTTGEVMRLDASGNLGLGVVPSAWPGQSANYDVLQAGLSSFANIADNAVEISFNQYIDSVGTRRYISSNVATRYRTDSGHAWYTAPSGTAGNTISFTQVMTLNASGNLLVGNTNGTSRITATGVIESTTGGFKFPDGTTQTTAATSPTAANVGNAIAGQNAGDVGTYALLLNTTTNSFSSGQTHTVSGNSLMWATSSGISLNSPPSGSVWMCSGVSLANNGVATAADRTTLWRRVS